MSFKYSTVCDTFAYIGYDVRENPEEILKTIKVAGYDGADLPGDLTSEEARVFRKIADSIGLALPEALGAWAYYHAGEDRDMAGGDEKARRRGIEYSKRAIDLVKDLGGQFFSVCASQPPEPQVPFPKLPIKTLRNNFLQACKEICRYAAGRGITILFEPLNRYEAYPGVMTSVYDAISLIAELGVDNPGIQPDIRHMYFEESSVPDALRAAGKLAKVVHINDTNGQRLGAGHADYKAILRALKEVDFTGYLSIYMPRMSQELIAMAKRGYGQSGGAEKLEKVSRPDLHSVLQQQLQFIKTIESAVDEQMRLAYAKAPYSTLDPSKASSSYS
jgi:sugar phosphate isomerase/epimerase